MIDLLILITLSAFIGWQLLYSFKNKTSWNILIQINSIGVKVLALFLVYAMINQLAYILDIILVLIVLNVVGTIIFSRYISKN